VGWADAGELAFELALGTGLAATAGLRTFLPLVAVGLAGRIGLVTLAPAFAWLGSTPALTIFGAAIAVEIVADKVAGVDHLLDLAATVIKPCVGALLVASVATDWSPLGVTLASILAGGGVAGVVHLGKAKLRLISTATTGGLGNALLSLAEDLGALAGAVLALLAPLVLLAALAAAALAVGLALRRRRA
jgi:hypothetical protein